VTFRGLKQDSSFRSAIKLTVFYHLLKCETVELWTVASCFLVMDIARMCAVSTLLLQMVEALADMSHRNIFSKPSGRLSDWGAANIIVVFKPVAFVAANQLKLRHVPLRTIWKSWKKQNGYLNCTVIYRFSIVFYQYLVYQLDHFFGEDLKLECVETTQSYMFFVSYVNFFR